MNIDTYLHAYRRSIVRFYRCGSSWGIVFKRGDGRTYSTLVPRRVFAILSAKAVGGHEHRSFLRVQIGDREYEYSTSARAFFALGAGARLVDEEEVFRSAELAYLEEMGTDCPGTTR